MAGPLDREPGPSHRYADFARSLRPEVSHLTASQIVESALAQLEPF